MCIMCMFIKHNLLKIYFIFITSILSTYLIASSKAQRQFKTLFIKIMYKEFNLLFYNRMCPSL